MKSYFSFIFITSLLFGYSTSSFAFQDIDALLDKSEITWAAEVYTDYAPNASHYVLDRKKMKAQYGISSNDFVALKIQQDLSKNPTQIHAVTLANQVLNIEPGNKVTFFKNASLKEPLSYADYQKITQESIFDTTFILQADGTSKVGSIITRKVYFDEVPLFRVKQILHYNEKTNELGLTSVAIAPVFCTYDREGDLAGTSPLFWMPIKNLKQEIDLNAPAINWAKRMTRYIHADEMNVIKGKEIFAEILDTITDRYAQAPESVKLYYSHGKMLPMSSKDIKTLNTSKNISLNPETFEEITSTIKNGTMNKIRIVQDWVWNNKTQSINIQLVGFAPILKRYDDNNNVLSSGLLFYKKSKD